MYDAGSSLLITCYDEIIKAGKASVQCIPTHTVTIPSTLTPTPVAPKASFTTDKTKGPAQLTVRFIDASKGTAPLTYFWDFNNDGATDSTIQNPLSYMYSVPGKYIVNLTVTNDVGSDTITKKITVT